MAHMQDAPSWILAIALVVLLLLIAFSSGTEVAMLSANRYKIRAEAKAGKRTARVLDDLLSKPDSWLGANLVVLALASVAASAIATLLAQRTGYEQAVPIAAGALAVFMIIFCELAPKIFAALKPDPVAMSSTYIYKVLAFLATPITWFTNKAAYGFLRLFGVKPVAESGQAMSPDELRSVVAEAGPMIPTRHRQMLLSILDLEHVTVNDIMVPRQDIATINVDDDWEDILDQLRNTPHTRLPLHEGELDNLVGIVHMKRVAQELARDTLTRERLIEIASTREPYFVPEGTSLTVQLNQFQRNRRRLAFVVDEYGDIQGFVTLEDILEEIVGEFTTDPATVTHKHVHREAPGVFIVNASATVRALNRSLGWMLPTDGPKTLNGLLVEQLETLPEAGAEVVVGEYHFEVLQIGENTVRTVRARKVAPAAAESRAARRR
jgi:Mg2+/Co2+ transporter CorB